MECAPDKPLFTLRNVDVLKMDIKNKTISLLVHVYCPEFELESDEIKSKVNDSVKNALHYITWEGWVPSTFKWIVNIAIAGHPPKE
jgi:hypothetical protein